LSAESVKTPFPKKTLEKGEEPVSGVKRKSFQFGEEKT